MHDTPTHPVLIETSDVQLKGDLFLPKGAEAIVVFAHGSGSSRRSPRNRAVAKVFYDAGLAALLFDLLTEKEEMEEELTRHHRFNIPFLTRRLSDTVQWLRSVDDVSYEIVGLFGASTGAAAALNVAAENTAIRTVVSRGGRPDLAWDQLHLIHCPVLLIVGEWDTDVLELNRKAAAKLPNCQISVVPGATHLFSEPGTLNQAAETACRWFLHHLQPGFPKI